MSTSITLHRATTTDIPFLAYISSQAFKTDPHTRLKDAIKPRDQGFDIAPALAMWMERPTCVVLKAILEGEVAGWACWGFRGGDVPPLPGAEKEGNEARKEEAKQTSTEPDKHEQTKEVDASAVARIAKLEELTNAAMKTHQATLMPKGTSCLYIIAITVLPTLQGRGVGRSLIRWGTRVANEKNVFCWVSSSDGGWGALRKEGFVEVGRLELVLDDYAGEARNEDREDGKWGSYVWRWMKRPMKG